MFWRRTGQAHAHPQIRSSPSPTAAETDAVRRKKNNKKGVVAEGTEAQGAAGPPASAPTAEPTAKQALSAAGVALDIFLMPGRKRLTNVYVLSAVRSSLTTAGLTLW